MHNANVCARGTYLLIWGCGKLLARDTTFWKHVHTLLLG